MHLQQVSNEVSDRLMLKFDKQMAQLSGDLDSFESELTQWELDMQVSITNNNKDILEFE